MYKVSLQVDMTVMPGTGDQRGSVEWRTGFAYADTPRNAVARAKQYYMSQNTDTCVIKILDAVVSPATIDSTGFFVDFFLPKTKEQVKQDLSYFGYFEFYLRVFFDDGDSADVAYQGDFSIPQNMPEVMDGFRRIASNFYSEKMGRTVTHSEFITREEYQKTQKGILLRMDYNNGKLTETPDPDTKPGEPYCIATQANGCSVWDHGKVTPGKCGESCFCYRIKGAPVCTAAADCGCTVWNHGRTTPGVCDETGCMDYHDGKENET